MDNCHKGLLEVIKNDEQFTFLREKYRDEINMLENLNNNVYAEDMIMSFVKSIMCKYHTDREEYNNCYIFSIKNSTYFYKKFFSRFNSYKLLCLVLRSHRQVV